MEPLEIVDLGEKVIVVVWMHGRGQGSSVPVEMTFAQLWSLRDNLRCATTRPRQRPCKVWGCRSSPVATHSTGGHSLEADEGVEPATFGLGSRADRNVTDHRPENKEAPIENSDADWPSC